jgi:hypothetical protein
MFNKQEVAVIFLIKSKKIDSNQTTRRQKSLLPGNPTQPKDDEEEMKNGVLATSCFPHPNF